MRNSKIFFVAEILVILTLNVLFLNSCENLSPEKAPEAFSIRNNTGDAIIGVYLRAPDTSICGIWGNNIILHVTIPHGGERSVTVPNYRLDSRYKTDIQLRTLNGNVYTKLSQTITHNGAVTFTNDDFDNELPRIISIDNTTGDYLSTIHFREPGTSIWGNGLSAGLSDSVIIPINRMDCQCRTDIQLRALNGNLYTKLSQDIIHNETVSFTSDDLDRESPRTISIVNITGDDLSSVHLKKPGTLIWSSGSSINLYNDDSTSVSIPNIQMNSQYQTDIQIRALNGNLYTKLSQDVIHNGTVSFSSDDLDRESPRTISIVNVTGDDLSSVHLKKPGTLIWSSGSSINLYNDDSTSIPIPNVQMNSQYQTDIQLRTSNGNLYTKLSQEIVHNGTVTFTSDDFNSESPRTISIVNITGDDLSTVHLREPGTLIWSNGLSIDLSNGGFIPFTVPYNHMNIQNMADIRLRTPNGNLYTKLSQTITHNKAVTFTSDDLDRESPQTIYISIDIIGNYLYSVHFRESGTLIWSGGSSIELSNGGFTPVNVPYNHMNTQNMTDIQLRATSDGILHTKLSQEITHNGTITFTNSDLDSTSARIIYISIDTAGDYLSTVIVHFREPGVSIWSSGSSIDLSYGGFTSVTVPYNYMNTQAMTDIQLRTTSGGISYTKLSQMIIHNGTVAFTNSDLDT